MNGEKGMDDQLKSVQRQINALEFIINEQGKLIRELRERKFDMISERLFQSLVDEAKKEVMDLLVDRLNGWGTK